MDVPRALCAPPMAARARTVTVKGFSSSAICQPRSRAQNSSATEPLSTAACPEPEDMKLTVSTGSWSLRCEEW